MKRLILCLKRNDQIISTDKNKGAKHLMPVCWHDEATMGEFDFTPRLQTQAFTHIEVPRETNLDILREVCIDEYDPITNPNPDRKRKYRFDINDLLAGIAYTDLESKLRSGDHIPLLNGKTLDIDKIKKHSIEIDYSKIPVLTDIKTVTSGSYSTGTAGADYAKWSTADADTGTMTGVLTFTQIDAISDTAIANFSGGNAGYTLHLTSDTPHNGDTSSGWLTTIAHSNICIALNQTGDGLQKVSYLRGLRATAGSSSSRSFVTNAVTASNAEIHDIIFDGGGLQGCGITAGEKSTGYLFKAYNFMIYDCVSHGIGFYTQTGNVNPYFECGGVRNCGSGFLDSSSVTYDLRNAFCFTNTTDFDVNGASTGTNLSSTDATAFGTDAHDNLTETDEVISTNKTSTDFMRVKAGGTNEDGGATPLYSTVDMAGVAWAANPSVGPFQYVAPVTGISRQLDGYLDTLKGGLQ